jgi:hypothetical protein
MTTDTPEPCYERYRLAYPHRGHRKGPVVTSKTAWTSPGHAGDYAAPRRY